MLLERIVKTERVRKGFNDVIDRISADKDPLPLLRKDKPLMSEIGGSLDSLKELVGSVGVVIEFEALFPRYRLVPKPEYQYSGKAPTKSTEEEGFNIYHLLQKFFPENLNRSAYRELENYYDLYSKNIPPYLDVINIDDYIDQNFQTVEEAIRRFGFDAPLYGWADAQKTLFYIASPTGKNRIPPSSDHQDIDIISQRLAKVFHGYTINQNIDPEWGKAPHQWYVEKDISLIDTKTEAGIEIVSAQYPADKIIEMVRKFKTEVYDYFKCTTDDSTGGHINIRIPNDSVVDFVKMIILTNDKRWSEPYGRFNNHWAQSHYQQLLITLRRLPDGLSFSEILDSLKKAVNIKKYFSINFLKDNMIEFRFPGNSYLDGNMFEHYLDTIKWCIFMTIIGISPNLFKKEYYSKIVRLYSSSRNLPTNEDKNKEEPDYENYTD